MKWSLLELNKFKGDSVQFSTTIDIEETLKVRNKEILSVTPVKVEGFVSVDASEYILHCQIEAVLTLPSTRSLEPVEFPCCTVIDEVYITKEKYSKLESHEDNESIVVLEQDILDLDETIEDHLLLAIPFQVLTEEEKNSKELPKGSYWEIISEEDYAKKKEQQNDDKIDPRLAKLSALLDNSEDTDEE